MLMIILQHEGEGMHALTQSLGSVVIPFPHTSCQCLCRQVSVQAGGLAQGRRNRQGGCFVENPGQSSPAEEVCVPTFAAPSTWQTPCPSPSSICLHGEICSKLRAGADWCFPFCMASAVTHGRRCGIFILHRDHHRIVTYLSCHKQISFW